MIPVEDKAGGPPVGRRRAPDVAVTARTPRLDMRPGSSRSSTRNKPVIHRFPPFGFFVLGLLRALTALLTMETGHPAVGFAVLAAVCVPSQRRRPSQPRHQSATQRSGQVHPGGARSRHMTSIQCR